MTRLIALTTLLLASGCASCGVTCFTDEVSSMVRSDLNSGKGFNTMAMDFILSETSGVQGLGRDMSIGTARETGLPAVYLSDLGDIFCPCP